jgi:hypothetical protein
LWNWWIKAGIFDECIWKDMWRWCFVEIEEIKDEVDGIYNIEDNKWRIRIKNTMMKS